MAERVHFVLYRLPPGHDLAGSNLGSRSVVELHPRPGRSRGSGERLGKGLHPAGDLGPPLSEVRGDFDLDRHKLEAAAFAHELRKNAHPTACLAREHSLQSFTLRVIGALIHKDANRDRVLLRPSISLKCYDRDHVEPIEHDVSVSALPNVIRHHALTAVVRGCLGEAARTGDVATTNVEPITLHPPRWNVRHLGNLHEVIDVPAASLKSADCRRLQSSPRSAAESSRA